MSPSASELTCPIIQRCAQKWYLAIQVSRLRQTRRKPHGWDLPADGSTDNERDTIE